LLLYFLLLLHIHLHDLYSFPTRRSSDLKNQLFLINETEFLRLPKCIRDHVSSTAVFKEIFFKQQSAYFMDEFENRLLELIAKLPDRKSTRLNSSHLGTSYAVICLNKTRA